MATLATLARAPISASLDLRSSLRAQARRAKLFSRPHNGVPRGRPSWMVTGSCDLRQQKAAPEMARLKQFLDEQVRTALPKSPLGKAVAYALGQWNAL